MRSRTMPVLGDDPPNIRYIKLVPKDSPNSPGKWVELPETAVAPTNRSWLDTLKLLDAYIPDTHFLAATSSTPIVQVE